MTITHCVGYDQPTYISTEFRQRVVNDLSLFSSVHYNQQQSWAVFTSEDWWTGVTMKRHYLYSSLSRRYHTSVSSCQLCFGFPKWQRHHLRSTAGHQLVVPSELMWPLGIFCTWSETVEPFAQTVAWHWPQHYWFRTFFKDTSLLKY